MPEGRDLAEAMAARDVRAERDWDGAAAAADIDVGMGGGGFTPVGDPRDFRAGPDNPDMPSPDVIAAIADQLDAASNAPSAVAVNQQGDRLSNAQVQALINLQDQYQTQDPLGNTTSVLDTWSNPYVSQNYSDYAQGGQNIVGQGNVSRGLNYANAMEIDARRQELSAELDRLNTLSVQASDATQPYPSSWSDPDEWGMSDTRLDQRMRGPGNVSDMDMLAQQGMPDPNARRSWEIQNPSPLASSSPGPIASHFPSPLTSVADYPADMEGMPNVGLPQASIAEGVMGAPGTYSGTVNQYDTARDASLAFDEYEMPSRQQQGVMRDIAQDDYMGTQPYNVGQGRLDQEGMGYYDNLVGSSRPSGRMDQEGGSFGGVDLETEEAAWRTVNDPDVDDYIEGKITAEQLSKINSEAKLEEVVTEATKTLSKKLTKDEKKANVAARRKAEEDYVAFRDELNFRVEVAKSGLAKEIKDHGKKSKEAKKARSILRGRKDDARMWERSDIYNKSYGMVNRPWLSNIGPMKLLTGIENYFHSLGKTERRSPQDLLDHMKANPEQYERVGAEISAAQLVRNMYSFLRKAPMDVAAAAAKEPAYLRYLINLNVNKQPIPTSYSSNWKNDISDAWIYG